jgi:hypothetical protein
VDITVATDAAEAKRRALEEYGINTQPSENPSGGDLLRVVFEIAGWNVEHFQRLA